MLLRLLSCLTLTVFALGNLLVKSSSAQNLTIILLDMRKSSEYMFTIRFSNGEETAPYTIGLGAHSVSFPPEHNHTKDGHLRVAAKISATLGRGERKKTYTKYVLLYDPYAENPTLADNSHMIWRVTSKGLFWRNSIHVAIGWTSGSPHMWPKPEKGEDEATLVQSGDPLAYLLTQTPRKKKKHK